MNIEVQVTGLQTNSKIFLWVKYLQILVSDILSVTICLYVFPSPSNVSLKDHPVCRKFDHQATNKGNLTRHIHSKHFSTKFMGVLVPLYPVSALV